MSGFIDLKQGAAKDARVDKVIQRHAEVTKSLDETDKWVEEIEAAVNSIGNDIRKLLRAISEVENQCKSTDERHAVFEAHIADRLDAYRKLIPIYEAPKPYDDRDLRRAIESLISQQNKYYNDYAVDFSRIAHVIDEIKKEIVKLKTPPIPWYKRIFRRSK